jgi:hypothetical protein
MYFDEPEHIIDEFTTVLKRIAKIEGYQLNIASHDLYKHLRNAVEGLQNGSSTQEVPLSMDWQQVSSSGARNVAANAYGGQNKNITTAVGFAGSGMHSAMRGTTANMSASAKHATG